MTNNQELYYRQWTTCHTMLGEDFSFLSFDLGLYRLLPRDDPKNVLQVLVQIQSSDENGLPNEQEADILERIGQALFSLFDNIFYISYVGYLASDKVCECPESPRLSATCCFRFV